MFKILYKIKRAFYLLAFVMILVGCNETTKVSGKTFQSEYERGHLETMHSVEYLGIKEGKAYLKKSTKSVSSDKWDDTIIYTEVEDLDEQFRKELPF